MINKKLSARQHGVSLIELMVGLVISLVVIGGMVANFTSLGRSAVQATLGASHDNKVMTGLLTADRVLQSVGFGLGGEAATAYGEIFQAFGGGSSKSLGQSADTVVWKNADGSCGALKGGQGLVLVERYTCGALSAPGSNEAGVTLIAGALANFPGASEVGNVSIQVVGSSACFPYGVKTGESATYTVEISAAVHAGSSSAAANRLVSRTCLINFG